MTVSEQAAQAAESSPIYAELKRRIASGRFAVGAKLPTLQELMSEYNESYQSVRKAITHLAHDGLVNARRGSGVYVRERPRAVRSVLLLTGAVGHEWAELARGFMDRFSAHEDMRLLIEQVPYESDEALAGFKRKLAEMLDNGLEAVLLNTMWGAHSLRGTIRGRVPIVVNYSREMLPDFVGGYAVSDWRQGGYMGVRHLIEVGCRDVLLLVPPIDEGFKTSHHRDFVRGCEAAAVDSIHKVRVRKLVAAHDDATCEPRFLQVLRGHGRPDAVFAHADFRAAPLIPLMQREGLRVPEDVAVLGYYDTPWTTMTSPGLSSISTRPAEVAAAAADMVLERRFNEQIVISPRLVMRGSTRRQESPP